MPISQRNIQEFIGQLRARGAGGNREVLRREKVDAIERGDDFAANEQLLQIVAVAKFFIAEEAAPKIRSGVSLLV